MAIDRAGRARKRWAMRAKYGSSVDRQPSALGTAALEVDGLFNPGRRHQLEYLARVTITREDERESGEPPLDLDSGVVRMTRRE